ncbi:GIY-YIG nuclease family protein [Robertkochia marina]|uniref:GIY-YIG nuclease family protein n=1 Tax=Robertkochia marina TaxID=1227945 RepID=A0A4S3M2C6_9FLAO|nr:GIY-YIG nuclease family protein [Robertkochia marina]THD69272.1 GIY-YIG nuclease family protein [Robertkochia marina]TRZ47469.1 GIY-YIG nuclease family protein [Robertkochia marina]
MFETSCVYILTNAHHTVLYVGVTSNLTRRIYQHKSKMYPGFTTRYNCSLLVYYETFLDMQMAIAREKQIKKRSRTYKINLIEADNPEWNDLSEGWIFDVI